MTAHDALISTAIYARCTGNPALGAVIATRCFDTDAPGSGVVGDYLLFQNVSGGTENLNPRESVDTMWLFKYVSEVQSRCKTGMGFLHDALHNAPLVISGWVCWRIVQVDLFTMPSGDEMSPAGKRLYVKGAYYRISIDQ